MRSMKISFLLIALLFQLFDYTLSDDRQCQTLLIAYKNIENYYISEEAKPTISVRKLHKQMLRVKCNIYLSSLLFLTILVFYNFNFNI